MDLSRIEITGFRRFQKRSVLRISGKVTALVGPNEAGKSSVLEAAGLLNDESPIPNEAISRGSADGECSIRAYFRLNKLELDAIQHSGPRTFFVQKASDGVLRYGFEPSLPTRDIRLREKLHADIISIASKPAIVELLSTEDETLASEAEETLRSLQKGIETLRADKVAELSDLADRFSHAVDSSSSKFIRDFCDEFKALVEIEKGKTPFQAALSVLKESLPEFLIFDDEQRELSSDYQISELESSPPAALINLLSLADISASDLVTAMRRGVIADITSLERRGNMKLERHFGEIWGQSGVNVSFRISPSLFSIQIVNEEGEFSALEERSEGLRQFVALQAFVQRHGSSEIILMIDEAENRLHYDAQADLVYMLTKQSSATSVIYTTHSAGCLPQDLGRGVKLVMMDDEQKTRSRIVNKFWGKSQKGLTPLMIGMGAATLAFFPTRKAVMVEGASDLLLLPRLFSEASGERMLEFQIIPGLASQGPALAHVAIKSEKHVLYLVDSDEGGDNLLALLKDAKIPADRIYRVGVARAIFEPEDLIEPLALVTAANALIKEMDGGFPPIKASDLRTDCRMESLEAAFKLSTGKKLLKVDLAYELLALVDENPDRMLSDVRRRNSLKKIWASLNESFKKEEK